ncbi:MAG: MBL fold metallo-hydrolase [Thermomicrobiales bacterium]|nr:MBL fold metallo-hydrolase [Thermomicrobiales bacterium]
MRYAEKGTAAGGTATQVAERIWAIDLGFQGWDKVVHAYLLAAPDELVLIETGPTATLPALRAGIRAAGFDPALLSKIFVSHIHLDHSGAAGVIVREQPEVEVFVHPVGVPHLVDPAKLVNSAGRLYTDRMEELWGEVAPVPQERVRLLADGETVEAAGHVMSVLFTPGHAAHHIAYWLPDESVVFTGDVGGVRMPGSDYALPPAPPPELAPGEWRISTERLRQTGAQRLLLTHGGAFDGANVHLDRLMPNLDEVEALVLEAMLGGADDEAVTDLIQAHTEERIGPAAIAADPGIVQRYGWASPSFLSALGFRRYLTKRGDLPAPPKP